MSKQVNRIINRRIDLSKKSMDSSIWKIDLVLDWIVLIYYTILMLSTINIHHSNKRIVYYSILYLFYDTLNNLHQYIELIDPLKLKPSTLLIQQIQFVCHCNILYLIIRIMFNAPKLYSILLWIHYIICMGLFQQFLIRFNHKNHNNNSLNIKNSDKVNFLKTISPILLYSFNITFNIDDIDKQSLIQLIFLILNFYISMENRKILSMKQSVFGWRKIQYKGKNKIIWRRHKALKIIIVVIGIILTIQNLLLLMQSFRTEISLAIIHTLIVGFTSYYLYRFMPKTYE